MEQAPEGQTFGIVDNGKVREMTPEEIERLDSVEETLSFEEL